MPAWLRKLFVMIVAFGLTFRLVLAEDEVQRRAAGVPLRGTITAESPNELAIQR